MDKKKVLKTAALLGSGSMIDAMAIGDTSHRQDVFRHETKTLIIDTCKTQDTDAWETGIKKTGGIWSIVEQYHNRKEAKSGHNKWIKDMTKTPDLNIDELDISRDFLSLF